MKCLRAVSRSGGVMISDMRTRDSRGRRLASFSEKFRKLSVTKFLTLFSIFGYASLILSASYTYALSLVNLTIWTVTRNFRTFMRHRF